MINLFDFCFNDCFNVEKSIQTNITFIRNTNNQLFCLNILFHFANLYMHSIHVQECVSNLQIQEVIRVGSSRKYTNCSNCLIIENFERYFKSPTLEYIYFGIFFQIRSIQLIRVSTIRPIRLVVYRIVRVQIIQTIIFGISPEDRSVIRQYTRITSRLITMKSDIIYGCSSSIYYLFVGCSTRLPKLMESLRSFGIRYVVLSRRAFVQRYRGEATLGSRGRAWSVISRRRFQRKWRPVTRRNVLNRYRRNVRICWRKCFATRITSTAWTAMQKVRLTTQDTTPIWMLCHFLQRRSLIYWALYIIRILAFLLS